MGVAGTAEEDGDGYLACEETAIRVLGVLVGLSVRLWNTIRGRVC